MVKYFFTIDHGGNFRWPPSGKPRIYNSLRRKKSKLNIRLLAAKDANNAARVKKLEDEVGLLSFKIKEAIVRHLDESERRAVGKIKENPKYFYSYAKSFSKVKNRISTLLDGEKKLVTDSKDLADILQTQFCSVFSDPNCPDKSMPEFALPPISTQDAELVLSPELIEEAISEIKLDSDPGPDGIPAILLKRFKVYERVVRKHMVQYLEANNLLSDKQHGFRFNRSCLTQMLDHFDSIFEGLTKGNDTDSIYLDFAKAFDKVDLDLLLRKLKRYGFHQKLIGWIQSFLTDREQVVVVNGVHSNSAKVLSGVPQGSVLDPLFFLLFINDLEEVVKASKVSFFADDTRVSKQISRFEDCALLQADLLRIIEWANRNNMKLHEQKFELLNHLHNRKNFTSELPFYVETLLYKVSGEVTLYPVEHVRDLGVVVSSDLSWSRHISNMVTKARSTLSWVFSVFKTRDRTVMITLYKSLVRSLLEYCCPLWDPTRATEMQMLEGVQRTFTSCIGGLNDMNYWERLVHLRLMSLQRRRERYAILMMWKILLLFLTAAILSSLIPQDMVPRLLSLLCQSVAPFATRRSTTVHSQLEE
ncbi:hypothetical protein ACHWQZ_G001943 [Mnemiopsis leidyi]